MSNSSLPNILVPTMFLLCIGLASCSDTVTDYQVSKAQVEIIVERCLQERLPYSLGAFWKPVSPIDVEILGTIPHYKRALSELLLEHIEPACRESYFVHICNIMAATGDEYFIDVLERAIGRARSIRAQGAAEYAIRVIKGEAKYWRGWCGMTRWQLLDAEGRPNIMVRYGDLDEEGRKLFRDKFPRADEIWIYYDEDDSSDSAHCLYGLRRTMAVYSIQFDNEFSKALISHLRKNKPKRSPQQSK